VAGLGAGADQGLVAPPADRLWPELHLRITLQALAASPLPAASLIDASATASSPRGLQSAAVLGDYYFATPSFGRFRASGGMVVGSLGGSVSPSAGQARTELAVSRSNPNSASQSAETSSPAMPYLGLGFSSSFQGPVAVSADVGMAASGLGRAVFGNAGMDRALREIRVTPMLQLGVRYAF
jgi:hypothetical protein